MIKIALVDDHIVLRKSLAVLIQMFPDFGVVLQASNGDDFIDQLAQSANHPDIVLLDITMPGMDGLSTAQWLKKNHPEIKVLVLSMIRNDFIIIRMLKSGARGYILKDCDPSELCDALQQVYFKGYYYNDLFTEKLRRKDRNDFEEVQLSPKELNFIRWACTEKTYKEIADEMNVSPRTVDGYRDTLFQKLNVTSRIGIAMYAIRNSIVQI